MNKEIEVYSRLCELCEFSINGIQAYYEDFGDKYDTTISTRKESTCGNMQFKPKPSTEAVLLKYNITINEYNEICAELKEKLSFGSCSYCS